MYPLIAMTLSLVLLVVLLHYKLRIGLSMFLSALGLSLLLWVSPIRIWAELASEWQTKPITQTTVYLFISLSALLLLVNVIGATMREAGISDRLARAMHGLFRSRRLALSAIPMMMGMLPTPGGIMLSAPMVREFGDQVGLERSRLAAINFFFRHQWESVWPLFPAVPLVQGILGVSAFAVVSHNIIITILGLIGGAIFLLLFSMPAKSAKSISHGRRLGHNIADFLHAFWPIVLTATLYIVLDIPPAVGILIGILGLFYLHGIPRKRWSALFKAAKEPDLVLLIASALLFRVSLQAAGAIPAIKDLMVAANLPPALIVFTLPFLVAFLTGMSMPTVAITFPFLTAFIGTGSQAQMGLETLAFSGLLCGLFLTPIHLCISLSAGYFQAPLPRILARLLLPTAFIGAAGIVSAIFF